MKPHTNARFVEELLLFSNLITSICCITATRSPTVVPNAVELLKSYQPFKIMKESILENVLSRVILVANVFDKGFLFWSTEESILALLRTNVMFVRKVFDTRLLRGPTSVRDRLQRSIISVINLQIVNSCKTFQ